MGTGNSSCGCQGRIVLKQIGILILGSGNQIRQRLRPMSALPPKADKRADPSLCLLRAKSEHKHRNEPDRYEQRPEQVIGRHASKRSPVTASRRASIEVFGAGAPAFWR
jgi:hypothetical protein